MITWWLLIRYHSEVSQDVFIGMICSYWSRSRGSSSSENIAQYCGSSNRWWLMILVGCEVYRSGKKISFVFKGVKVVISFKKAPCCIINWLSSILISSIRMCSNGLTAIKSMSTIFTACAGATCSWICSVFSC